MKINILHIIKDDKFFEPVKKSFEEDDRLNNIYCLIKKYDNYNFKYIKNISDVKVYNYKNIRFLLKNCDYDVIYFHSISETIWSLFPCIPKDRIIIWWIWGYDVYLSRYIMLDPLIKIQLYKPLTQIFVNSQKYSVKKVLHDIFLSVILRFFRYYALKRINYIQPIINNEYELIVESKNISPKIFFAKPKINRLFTYNNKNNEYVLLGNSSTPTNNHIDVWNQIKDKINHKIIVIPLNYGDFKYRETVKKEISSEHNEIIFLEKLIPKEEYFDLLSKISFAIFGSIRQQAMSNITFCLKNGIKIFLYKDSLMYKFLKSKNFNVFTIEDIDTNSFQSELTLEESKDNFEKYILWQETKDKIYENAINEFVFLNNKPLV